MPNKTIYIKQEEVELWQRAERLYGGRISNLLGKLIRKYVEEEEQMQEVRDRHKESEVRRAFSEAVDSGLFFDDEVTLGTQLGEERDFAGLEDESIEVLLTLLWENGSFMPKPLREHVSDMPFAEVMSEGEIDAKMAEDGSFVVSTYGEAAQLLYRLVEQGGE